jgi:hypothetical protein
MVLSRPLGASNCNRASDGGALESNGIIVGNKNEFKEVGGLNQRACAMQETTIYSILQHKPSTQSTTSCPPLPRFAHR